jgi:peptidoglycan DL-endopeptidase CwlO
MPSSATRGRRRSPGRPTTSLDDLATATSASLATAGRRSAVAAAGSGLLLSIVAVPASAHGSGAHGASVAGVNTAALTASAHALVHTSPVVAAAPDAVWGFDAPTLTAVAPPPVVEAEPEPAPAAASRSAARAAAAEPAAQEAPAAEAEPIGAAAPASANGNAIVEIAARYVGVPYLSGGSTPEGFDCSGFTSYVYAQVGITLPRTSSAQRGAGTVVSRAEAQPGDLIWSPGHISIYAGDNMQVDAPRPGKTIQIR